MVRPKVDQWWKDTAFEEFANEVAGAPSIGKRLREIGAREGHYEEPSPRTVVRWRKEYRRLDEEKQRPFRFVRWPESFQRGDLCWEAVPAFLDLLRWNHEFSPPRPGSSKSADSPEWLEWAQGDAARRQKLLSQGIRNRPTVRLVKWLYRITQAAPDSPFDWQLEMAGHLAASEGAGALALHEQFSRGIENQITTGLYQSIAVWLPGLEKEGD